MITTSNIKAIIITAVLIAAVWIFKDWQFQKKERAVQEENVRQLLEAEKTHSAELLLNNNQLNEYIQGNEDLKALIAENNIKASRIEKVTEVRYEYLEAKEQKKDITPVVENIKKNINFSIPLIDSTECLVIKGSIDYKDDSLSYRINSRKFNNKTTTVGFWERRQWKFLFIKSRLFGKIQAVTFTRNQCGESNTQVINLNKND